MGTDGMRLPPNRPTPPPSVPSRRIAHRLFDLLLWLLLGSSLAALVLCGVLSVLGSPVGRGGLEALSGLDFAGASAPGTDRARAAIPPRGVIRLDDETFDAVHRELHAHLERYLGREIELAGTVTLQGVGSRREFLVGRTLQWCCENDRVFIGFLTRGPDGRPKEGARIRVRGTLASGIYRNPGTGKEMVVPLIRASALRDDRGYSEVVYPLR